MLIRCSSLSKVMTKPKSGSGLSETAKSHIKECVLAELYGFRDFTGNKYTKKGIECEDEAIKVVGALNALNLKKHFGRVENDWISGECDIITSSSIHDVKCPWSIGTHPFFDFDAEAAVTKAGYDWQGRGYMWLYDRPMFHVHYVLLPTPHHLHGFGDVSEMLVEAVEAIPLKLRVKTVTIERDKDIEVQIAKKVSLAQEYAKTLIKQLESA